jgi:hypothetical protein
MPYSTVTPSRWRTQFNEISAKLDAIATKVNLSPTEIAAISSAVAAELDTDTDEPPSLGSTLRAMTPQEIAAAIVDALPAEDAKQVAIQLTTAPGAEVDPEPDDG